MKLSFVTQFENPMLRLPSVIACAGISRSTIYSRISQGLWTKPVRIGERSVGWPANEISVLNAARVSCKNNEEIRNLVLQLAAARKHAK